MSGFVENCGFVQDGLVAKLFNSLGEGGNVVVSTKGGNILLFFC